MLKNIKSPMKISQQVAKKIKKAEPAIMSTEVKSSIKSTLLFSTSYKLFYKLLSPIMKEKGLTKDEINSELFIFCAALIKRYDPKKSSLIPFLCHQVPWEMARFFKKFSRPVILQEQIQREYSYKLNEDCYLEYLESILFENRFIGKVFTPDERCVIYHIALDEGVNCLKLSRKLGIDRKTIKDKVESIRSKLSEELLNVESF